MNKRIRRKKGLLDPKLRVWPPFPGTTGPTKYRGHPPSPERLGVMLGGAHVEFVESPAIPIAEIVFKRRSSYSSVDLSWMRRHPRNYVSTHEHRRVEAAIRRLARRYQRWEVKHAFGSPHGHMHREEDWMPKP